MTVERALEINRTAITPALALLPERMDNPQARTLLLAICGQEADFHHRWQVVDRARPDAMGPARGLWQFERGGGVRGVLNHPSSKALALDVCQERNTSPTLAAVYAALSRDDVLAGCFARLLLWTDPAPLPAVGDVSGAFALYLRTWRPGAYDRGSPKARAGLRQKWDAYYEQAMLAAAEGNRDLNYLRNTVV